MEKLNLYQKILEIRKSVEVIKKENKGEGIKYNYVNEEQILLSIKKTMNDLGLLLIPSVTAGTINSRDFEYKNNKGQEKKEVITNAEMTYTWIDIESGDKLETNWALFGQNASASQSFGSGLTYANKYYLLKFFNIATTDDDPDKLIQEQEAKEERKKINGYQTKIKKQFEKAIQKYQTKDIVYEKLGTTREDFVKDFTNPDKQEALLEQLELILKEG